VLDPANDEISTNRDPEELPQESGEPATGDVSAPNSRRRFWKRVVIAFFCVVLGLSVIALVAFWMWPRRIPSSGGLPFPWRLELNVPSFAQGDPRWADDPLGPTDATIHAEGCAISSAAMVLASYGLNTDPGRLNQFVTKRSGYTEQGWLYWEKAAEIQPGYVEKAYEDLPSFARIDWNLLCGNPVIVRIRLPNTNHFVVIAGKQGREYLIRDPGAGTRRGFYPLSEIAEHIEALRYYRKLR
jgi:hypothetical protein